ncbi:TadE/TadG family type IV pilus assembly protein [Aquisalinus flavus]|uniref:TadE-like domain-containing protein n=1 Tax=Aquisalinus flavus TaxID=1526572 RepID=A0A8J2V173_9PROT|nr:TadE family protein [Aquisalinus flavus]MBD0427576.1 pilus assembly protein [Aquisalinus flavus]UNE47368.1 pilus assembly protein [Aquisalinus flavus]GGD02085.1 hypothetical protein GCM10011342_08890 [Aquisalinus flavus]
MKRFQKNDAGIAATEFALVMPVIIIIFLSVYELSFRFQLSDELERYAFQLSDITSRFDELTDSDIKEFHDVSEYLLPSVDLKNGNISFILVSIGYKKDHTPVLLWKRSAGSAKLDFDIKAAEGLAEPGQSVIVAVVRIQANTLLSVFGDTKMTKTVISYSKPRTTRAIAINGDLTDVGKEVTGYEHD